jgi:hypothetical protein
MSEYQYYEFLAIDRPLDEQQMAYMRTLSSRVDLAPTRAAFVYHYGDFRGEPLKVLEEHFDVLFYVANWGSRQLAFRFPRSTIDLSLFRPYYMIEQITIKTTERHVILDINFHEEGRGDWIEGEGMLGSMALLRQEIMQGDMRALYLAWLKAAESFGDGPDDGWDDATQDPEIDRADGEGDIEPPVPPGLKELSAALRAFAEFLEIDQDVVVAAAEASPPIQQQDDQIERRITLLPEAERNAFLIRAVRGEPNIGLAILRRLREVAGSPSTEQPTAPRRSFRAIQEAAQEQKKQRKAREREQAKRARILKLEALAKREPETWTYVKSLIERKQGSTYDEAVKLLVDLRDLASHQGKREHFTERFNALMAGYANRPALLDRIRKAGLK